MKNNPIGIQKKNLILKIHYGKALIFESVDYTLDLNYYTLNDVEYS